jgi:NAD(P)-dependent dehydrogenase (short-subunit alcohol dehydrogenase family)
MEVVQATGLFMEKIPGEITERAAKVVLITGGARGLGRTLAEFFTASGAKVIVLDRLDPQNLPTPFYLSLFHYEQIDLANNSALESVFQAILQKTDKRLDVLINNAWPRDFKNFESFSTTEISTFLDSSLKASFLLTNWAIPLMKQGGFGRIIQISSRSAFKGYSTGSLYCSTKMALIAFHESLSRELIRMDANIGILTICPDSFSTSVGTVSSEKEWIARSVCSRIERFARDGHSSIVYVGRRQVRILVLSQILQKLKYMLSK